MRLCSARPRATESRISPVNSVRSETERNDMPKVQLGRIKIVPLRKNSKTTGAGDESGNDAKEPHWLRLAHKPRKHFEDFVAIAKG
jgi:hypothetical protein